MPQLDFNKTMQLLKKYRIPHCSSVLCKKPAEAVKSAEKMGFPVVLKISSVDIIHKSDINAVKVDLETKEEVEKAFNDIMKSVKKKMPKAKLQGIIVQKQKTGKHIIVGVKNDPQFGPALMFGLGGLFVEIFKDGILKEKKVPQPMLENTEYHLIFHFFIMVNEYVSE